MAKDLFKKAKSHFGEQLISIHTADNCWWARNVLDFWRCGVKVKLCAKIDLFRSSQSMVALIFSLWSNFECRCFSPRVVNYAIISNTTDSSRCRKLDAVIDCLFFTFDFMMTLIND